MRLFISGSAPLLADTHREWSARTGHARVERYGMTETNMNTSNPYDGERVPGAVGHPCPASPCASPPRDRQGDAPTRSACRGQGPNVFRATGGCGKDKIRFRDDGFFITAISQD